VDQYDHSKNAQSNVSAEITAQWRKALVEGHRPLRLERAVFGALPGSPRCKVCLMPFGGLAGKLASFIGYRPSRKNPNLCSICCEALPRGGAEVEIAVLFADIRGSTALGEHMEPGAYAALLERFYRAATDVLLRHDALIDKLIGDEVMALFIPGICGPEFRWRAAQAASELLEAVGYGRAEGPWIPLGGGVTPGLSYVGNIGSEGVVDFTALGNTVNTAARLAASAAPGEILLGEQTCEFLPKRFRQLERRMLSLRGKEGTFEVRVLRQKAT
jgi:adenylate cyclase